MTKSKTHAERATFGFSFACPITALIEPFNDILLFLQWTTGAGLCVYTGDKLLDEARGLYNISFPSIRTNHTITTHGICIEDINAWMRSS